MTHMQVDSSAAHPLMLGSVVLLALGIPLSYWEALGSSTSRWEALAAR
jgi:hypothetical protein